MTPDSKIYVAGHRGLVGSALLRRLDAGGYRNLITRTHADLDLTDQQAVNLFFEKVRPDYVFLAAARAGGIHANDTRRAEFIYQNLAIQLHVIHAAYRADVKKLLFLGSSCIYPKYAPQPMKEEHLLTGPLEPTNEPYAVAKIAGIKMCGAYNRQYGTNFLSVMPTNLYGPNDNYDVRHSHVLPALVRRMHEAHIAGSAQVEIWGSGSPQREFLFSDDLADACVFLMERFDSIDIGECINVGSGEEVSIRELAALVAEAVGYRGGFAFNSARPDGTPRKLLDSSRLRSLGWRAKTDLRSGLKHAYQDYLGRHPPINRVSDAST